MGRADVDLEVSRNTKSERANTSFSLEDKERVAQNIRSWALFRRAESAT